MKNRRKTDVKPTRKDKFYERTGIAILFFFTICLLMFIHWSFWDYKTIEFKGDYKTAQLTYKQGDIGSYTVDYCKYTDVAPILTKKFVDGVVFTTSDTKAVIKQGCGTQLINFEIPPTLPPGRYRLVIDLEYNVNPIRSIKITHQSNWFTVLENCNIKECK